MIVEYNQFIGKAILKRIFALVCLFFFSLSKVFFRYIAAESTNYQQRIVFKVEKTAAVFLFLPNCSTTTTPSPPTAVSFLWSVVFDTRRCQKEIGLEKKFLETVHIFLIKVRDYLKGEALFYSLIFP